MLVLQRIIKYSSKWSGQFDDHDWKAGRIHHKTSKKLMLVHSQYSIKKIMAQAFDSWHMQSKKTKSDSEDKVAKSWGRAGLSSVITGVEIKTGQNIYS